MECFMKEIPLDEQKRREHRLDEVEAILGAEAKIAMSEYLDVIDEKFYMWLASLYDPATGGLYYSISARDNDGFLPDLESTPRGWRWLCGSGMLEIYDHDLKRALPEWLQKKVLSWMLPLQSPKDGYFYHPQWGGTETLSRLGRDLDFTTGFIKMLGGEPLYDARNGTKGSLGAPSDLAECNSAENSDDKTAHFKSIDAFLEYLDGFDWDNRSYYFGSLVESQATQIKAAGEKFRAAFEKYMNGRQERIQKILAEEGRGANGLWQIEVAYTSINGLMKLTNAYTRIGLAIPYAKEAFESALSMVTHEGADRLGKSADSVVDVYNPWCAISNLINNVSKFGDTALSDEMRETLKSRAPELIRATTKKFKRFKKPDGSFGYRAGGGQPTSQSMPVAVKGVDEGDVNGATIAVTAILGNMCAALGINKPQLYFNSDFEKFMSIIEKRENGK